MSGPQSMGHQGTHAGSKLLNMGRSEEPLEKKHPRTLTAYSCVPDKILLFHLLISFPQHRSGKSSRQAA